MCSRARSALALCCDLIVAKESATFGTPEINVGRLPVHDHGADLPQRPAQEDQRAAAARRADLGRGGAGESGIVNQVVPAGEFEAAVDEWATKLAAKSPVLMKLGKDAMYRQLDMPFEDALDFLRAQLSLAFTTDDIQEGVKAFFEKREPNWTGR